MIDFSLRSSWSGSVNEGNFQEKIDRLASLSPENALRLYQELHDTDLEVKGRYFLQTQKNWLDEARAALREMARSDRHGSLVWEELSEKKFGFFLSHPHHFPVKEWIKWEKLATRFPFTSGGSQALELAGLLGFESGDCARVFRVNGIARKFSPFYDDLEKLQAVLKACRSKPQPAVTLEQTPKKIQGTWVGFRYQTNARKFWVQDQLTRNPVSVNKLSAFSFVFESRLGLNRFGTTLIRHGSGKRSLFEQFDPYGQPLWTLSLNRLTPDELIEWYGHEADSAVALDLLNAAVEQTLGMKWEGIRKHHPQLYRLVLDLQDCADTQKQDLAYLLLHATEARQIRGDLRLNMLHLFFSNPIPYMDPTFRQLEFRGFSRFDSIASFIAARLFPVYSHRPESINALAVLSDEEGLLPAVFTQMTDSFDRINLLRSLFIINQSTHFLQPSEPSGLNSISQLTQTLERELREDRFFDIDVMGVLVSYAFSCFNQHRLVERSDSWSLQHIQDALSNSGFSPLLVHAFFDQLISNSSANRGSKQRFFLSESELIFVTILLLRPEHMTPSLQKTLLAFLDSPTVSPEDFDRLSYALLLNDPKNSAIITLLLEQAHRRSEQAPYFKHAAQRLQKLLD